jgi:shikimate dehydrogenase
MNRYGLLGRKLGHSLSKIIHEYIFEKSNIDATYDLIELEEDEILDKINLLRSGYYSGFNVTIPYKETVIPYLDKLTDAAKEINAVNTIYMSDGKLIGDNTDYLGFIDQLNFFNIDVTDKEVYVLGSGGASKAIVYALNKLNAKTIVVSRNISNGITYEEFKNIKHYDLIINTTPIGMYPNIDGEVLEKEVVEKADICIDLITTPKVTKFLEYSKIGFNGIYMLIFQAIHAEEIWNKFITFDVKELYNML